MKKDGIALGFCVALAAGTAIGQVATSLSHRLSAVGHHYADAAGYIPVTTTNDGIKYIATADGQDPFVAYNVGDYVADGATLAVCGINSAGGLVGCDPAYGVTMLYALEDVQSAGPDSTLMTLQCDVLFGTTGHCKITWLDGRASCYACSGDSCAKPHC
ncbi:hypothetical protein [Polyangium sp. 6x1]|uniref:hypothetical protein n=1 Tax=Polyangium sp. 6x1 TaxID=3042689 RepID=UPI002482CFA8|nr:hypothetical protein [Polyangium sp. 6x1]MDI1442710.1 hypothetical protein [Polyangium sp. 6x1]